LSRIPGQWWIQERDPSQILPQGLAEAEEELAALAEEVAELAALAEEVEEVAELVARAEEVEELVARAARAEELVARAEEVAELVARAEGVPLLPGPLPLCWPHTWLQLGQPPQTSGHKPLASNPVQPSS
jgi:hypothetical protein